MYPNSPTSTNSLSTERHLIKIEAVIRIIETTSAFLIALMGTRFVLALFGANAENGFASFVYGVTQPFVAPFYNLFSYDHPSVLGVATFEGYTLVAMFVYSLLTAGIVRVVGVFEEMRRR